MLNSPLVAEKNFRQKRNAKNVNKKSNVSEIVSREYIKREVRLAISNLACVVHCPKGVRGRRGKPGPQVNMGQLGLRDHKDQEELKEIRGLLDLKVIRGLKDPRVILVNPSQLL